VWKINLSPFLQSPFLQGGGDLAELAAAERVLLLLGRGRGSLALEEQKQLQALKKRPALTLGSRENIGQKILFSLVGIRSISGMIYLILICKLVGVKVAKS